MPEPIQPRSEPNAPEPNEPEAVAAGVTAQTPTPTEPGSESGQATEVTYLTEGSSGLTYAVDRFKGWPHGGHVTLARGERSRLADFASEVL